MIAWSLRSPKTRVLTMVLEMLGAVCLIPNGHKRVLDAVGRVAKKTHARRRFDLIVSLLHKEDGSHERRINLQIAVMSFINVVVSLGPCKDDFEFRVHTRFEFLDSGLEEAIAGIDINDNDVLKKQIKIFLTKMKNDDGQLGERYDRVKSKINYDDPSDMFNTMYAAMSNSTASMYIQSLMKHFLQIPAHELRRPMYWRLFDKIVQAVVVPAASEGETDPVNLAVQALDIKKLVDNWVTEQVVTDSNKRAEQAVERAKKMQKELADAQKELKEKTGTLLEL